MRRLTPAASASIPATRARISPYPRIASHHLSQPGSSPAGVPIQQLRLQPHRATGDRWHQRNPPAALDRGRTSQQGVLPKNQRELLFDDNWRHHRRPEGPNAWVEFESGAATRRRKSTASTGEAPSRQPEEWTWPSRVPPTGRRGGNWGAPPACLRPSGSCRRSLPPTQPLLPHRFRSPGRRQLARRRSRVLRTDRRVEVGGPYDFTSAWMSAGTGEEWVYVDLGAALHVRPRGAVLDPARRRGRASGFRRRRARGRPAAAAQPAPG